MPSNFLPFSGNESVGLRTAHGTWLPPGSRVAAYVGPQSESTDAYSSSSLLVATLEAGFARCRSGKGDVVAVLPGHTQTVTTQTLFSALVAGTQIIGCAPFMSGLMPTITVTGTTTVATSTISVANVSMSGIRWNMNGADSMDTPLVITGAGCSITDCVFLTGSDTALDSDVAITVSTGADNFNFLRNYVYSTGTAVNTNSLLVSAAVDSCKIKGNTFMAPATSTNGIIQIGAAAVVPTNVEIGYNVVLNKSTGSACIGFTDVAMTGVVYNNYCAVSANTAPATTGIVLAGTTNILVHFFNNQTNDNEAKGTSGVISPAANDNT